MKIEHIAIWTKDLERLRSFYCTYFDGVSNKKYVNAKKGFQSYFISFSNGARLEIMQKDKLEGHYEQHMTGLAHLAISVGSKENVDTLTESLKKEGVPIISNPRTTGDGYYEAVISDPDGNWIEITI